MKTILCFGDSNCWGTIAESKAISVPSRRYPMHVRWTSVVQDALGDDYHVVEEGLSGRTTIFSVPGQEFKRADTYIDACMMSHRPIDLVVLMLGGNDLRLDYGADYEHLDYGTRKIVEMIQKNSYCGDGVKAPEILIVCPIDCRVPTGRFDFFEARGGEVCIERVKALQKAQRLLAEETGCYYLDSTLYGEPDEKDGFHLTKESHLRLGKAVADKINKIFTDAQ